MYPNLRGRPFNISPFEYDVSCRLAILTFFSVVISSFDIQFFQCFYHEKFYALSNVFSISI